MHTAKQPTAVRSRASGPAYLAGQLPCDAQPGVHSVDAQPGVHRVVCSVPVTFDVAPVCLHTDKPMKADVAHENMSSGEPEKSERVVSYVTPQTKSAIEAASGELSVAAWIRSAIKKELKNEHQEAVVEGTNAEQRIEALIAEAGDEIAEATREYHDLLALSAVYSVGSFRLLGDYGGFSDPQRKAAIEDGVSRVQEPDVPDFDLVDDQDQQQPKPPESWDVGPSDDSNDSKIDINDVLDNDG